MPVGIAAQMQKSQAALLGVTFALLLGAATPPARAQTQSLSAERYKIDVSFQPEKGFLHARATIGLRTAEKLDAIEFELNPHLKILDVTDVWGGRLDFARSHRLGSPKLSVRLAEAVEAGREITLTFTYEGSLPRRPLDYITKDGILLRDESRWYPAVDLSAFTQSTVHIGVPSGWRAVASGIPQGAIGLSLGDGHAWEA